eukprot:1207100-Rhodomonas_salina.3
MGGLNSPEGNTRLVLEQGGFECALAMTKVAANTIESLCELGLFMIPGFPLELVTAFSNVDLGCGDEKIPRVHVLVGSVNREVTMFEHCTPQQVELPLLVMRDYERGHTTAACIMHCLVKPSL